MWPLISPASGAPVSLSFALMSECPVFHITGSPPWSRIQPKSWRVHFTSKMTFAPGLRCSTSAAKSMSWRSG